MNAVAPDEDLTTTTLDALEDEIGFLCGHLNAGEYRLLELVGELDRREPWNLFNCKSCAHYLNWKCGIALGAAREKVRTARGLRELPQTSEAFRLGRISYSKARAITRVATAENEDHFLNIAFYGTASHVERVVRDYRQVASTLAPEKIVERRMFDCYWDEDGTLVFRGRLTPDQGAVLLKALDQARVPTDANDHQVEAYAASGADALVHIAEGFLAAAGGDAHTADRYQVRVSVSAQTLRKHRMRYPQPNPQADPQVAADVPNLEPGPPVSLQTAQRLTCDGSAIPIVEDAHGNPLHVGRKTSAPAEQETRTVPPALRRAVERRDGGCRFPGCTQVQHVDCHHIVHWAHGGETKLDNLMSLCRKHHTCLHEGGYRIERTLGGFDFLDDEGRIIEANGDRRFRGNVFELIEHNADRGIDIDTMTSLTEWDGMPVDYNHVMYLLFFDVDFSNLPLPESELARYAV